MGDEGKLEWRGFRHEGVPNATNRAVTHVALQPEHLSTAHEIS